MAGGRGGGVVQQRQGGDGLLGAAAGGLVEAPVLDLGNGGIWEMSDHLDHLDVRALSGGVIRGDHVGLSHGQYLK